jgi:hypothetical protein
MHKRADHLPGFAKGAQTNRRYNLKWILLSVSFKPCRQPAPRGVSAIAFAGSMKQA